MSQQNYQQQQYRTYNPNQQQQQQYNPQYQQQYQQQQIYQQPQYTNQQRYVPQQQYYQPQQQQYVYQQPVQQQQVQQQQSFGNQMKQNVNSFMGGLFGTKKQSQQQQQPQQTQYRQVQYQPQQQMQYRQVQYQPQQQYQNQQYQQNQTYTQPQQTKQYQGMKQPQQTNSYQGYQGTQPQQNTQYQGTQQTYKPQQTQQTQQQKPKSGGFMGFMNNVIESTTKMLDDITVDVDEDVNKSTSPKKTYQSPKYNNNNNNDDDDEELPNLVENFKNGLYDTNQSTSYRKSNNQQQQRIRERNEERKRQVRERNEERKRQVRERNEERKRQVRERNEDRKRQVRDRNQNRGRNNRNQNYNKYREESRESEEDDRYDNQDNNNQDQKKKIQGTFIFEDSVQCITCKGQGYWNRRGYCSKNDRNKISDCALCEGKCRIKGKYTLCRKCGSLGYFNQRGDPVPIYDDRAVGACTSCFGRGYHLAKFDYNNLYNCPTCEGKGHFARHSWVKQVSHRDGRCRVCVGNCWVPEYQKCRKCDISNFLQRRKGCTECKSVGYKFKYKIDKYFRNTTRPPYNYDRRPFDCHACKGKGFWKPGAWVLEKDRKKSGPCPLCKGRHIVRGEWTECRKCNGRGGFTANGGKCAFIARNRDSVCTSCLGAGYQNAITYLAEGSVACPACKAKGHFGKRGFCGQSRDREGNCLLCKGHCVVEPGLQKCRECGGKGMFTERNQKVYIFNPKARISCSRCNGGGYHY